ncbi:MAG: phosphotransferase [Lachnospiraceae bacterium]|nr:phosphotransferase [Lachnospiraceae bacterium]MBP3568740.1 phosphotransferase [Lachnospiraceae bacterium]
MKKTETKINIAEFPKELHYLFEGATIYDSSSHPTMTTLYSNLGYYIKFAEKGALEKDAELGKLFESMLMGVEVVHYISEGKDYLVTKEAVGEDALAPQYLANPEKLCEALASAMKYLHSRPVEGVPVSACMDIYAKGENAGKLKQDTFIHGDFCLPNIILDDWKFSTFIDTGLAGVGDKHIDLYWVLWSLNYNLQTDKYTEYFLEQYGKEKVDMELLKLVKQVEEQA